MTRTTNHPTAASPAAAATQGATPRGKWRTRKQLCDRHEERYGVPLSARTIERWPLTWRYMNGEAIADVDEFDAECERRLNATPAIRGGRRRPDQQEAA